MNTVPYTNAAREGRTKPDLIEVIQDTDPRHRNHARQLPNNRSGRRARGIYRGFLLSNVSRRMVRSRRRQQKI